MGLLDDAIREHLELKRKHGAPESEIERAEQEALTPARRDPTAGAGVPAVEEVEGAPLGPDDVPPPPPPPAAEEPVAGDETEAAEPPPPPPPVDEPVYADEYAADLPPADPDAPEPALPLASEEDEDEDDLALPPEPPAQETQVRSVIEPPGAVAASSLDPEAEEAPPPGTAKPHGDPAIEEDDLDADEFEPDEVPSEEQLGREPGEPDPYRSRTTILDDPLDESAPPPPAHPPPAGDPAAADEADVLEETPDFLRETPEHDKLWFEQKPPRDFDFD